MKNLPQLVEWVCLVFIFVSTSQSFKLNSRFSRPTALFGELRLLIHGTKNAYTTLRPNDLIIYRLDTDIDGCSLRIGVFGT